GAGGTGVYGWATGGGRGRQWVAGAAGNRAGGTSDALGLSSALSRYRPGARTACAVERTGGGWRAWTDGGCAWASATPLIGAGDTGSAVARLAGGDARGG